MFECQQHHLQFTAYSYSLSKGICSQCQKPTSEELLSLEGNIQTLKQKMMQIEQIVMDKLKALDIQSFKNNRNSLNIDFIEQNSPLNNLIQSLLNEQALFWKLPQMQLILQNNQTLNWQLLKKYGVINKQIQINKFDGMQQYLLEKIKNLKQMKDDIQSKIQKQRLSRNNFQRQSEPFQDLMQGFSSGSEANDLVQINIPNQLRLQQNCQQLTRLVQKKKAALFNYRNTNQQQDLPNLQQIIGQQNNTTVQASQNQQNTNPVIQVQSKSEQQIELDNLIDLIMKMKSQIESKKYQQALKIVNQILTKQPSNQEVLHIKAKLLYCTKKRQQSFELYCLLTKDMKSNPDFLYEMAYFYIQKKRYDESRIFVEQLFKHQPIKPDCYSLKGDLILLQKSNGKPFDKKIEEKSDIQQIQQYYNKANRAQPQNINYIYRLSIFYFNQKKLQLSLTMINEALKLDSENIQFKKLKAFLHLKMGKYGQSGKILSQIKSQESSIETLGNYAISLYFNKQYVQSRQAIVDANKKYPNKKDLIVNMLIIFSGIGDYQEAFRVIQSTFQSLSSYPPYILKACEIARHIQNKKQAENLLFNLKSMKNQNVSKQFKIAFYSLAVDLKNEDILKQGVKQLSKLLSQQNLQSKLSQFWNLLGLMKISIGLQGLQQFKTACSLSQVQLKTAYVWNCAVSYYKNGTLKQSLDCIQKCILLKQKKAKYLQFRICILIKIAQFETASKYLTEYQSNYPDEIKIQTFDRIQKDLKQLKRQI